MAPRDGGTTTGPATHRTSEELTVGVAERDGISVPREAGQATGLGDAPGDVPDGLARRLEALERASIESGDARKLMEDAQADLHIEICTVPTSRGIDRFDFRADRAGVYIGCGSCLYPHDQVRRLRDFLNDLYGHPAATAGLRVTRLTESQARGLAHDLTSRRSIKPTGFCSAAAAAASVYDALDHVGVIDPDPRPANASIPQTRGKAAPAEFVGNSLKNRPVNEAARAQRLVDPDLIPTLLEELEGVFNGIGVRNREIVMSAISERMHRLVATKIDLRA